MSTIIETKTGDKVQVWVKDPYSAQKRYRKKRLAEDPEYREKEMRAKREASREKYAQNPEYRQKCLEATRKTHLMKKAKTLLNDEEEQIICDV